MKDNDTIYVHRTTKITYGKDCPVPCYAHAGFIECPNCGNDVASVLCDDEDHVWHTDCGVCDYWREADVNLIDGIAVEMNVVRDAMTTWTGIVPKELFNSDNPKRAIAEWLWEHGTCSEVDFDNILIDSFDYDRDAVDGTDVKGDY